MNHYDLDPKGFLPLIQPLVTRLLVRLGLRGEPQHHLNYTCCV